MQDTLGINPPGRKPSFFRDGNPSFGACEVGLNIGLLGVRLLDVVPRKTAITINILTSFHGSRRGSKILENSTLIIPSANIIPLENNTIFKLSVLVIFVLLMVFLNHDTKDATHVDDSFIDPGLSGNVLPVLD